MEEVSTTHPNPLIPSEIIEAILLRLPSKPLGRFKSVSKTWNSLISDPLFIKTHTHQLLHQPKKKLLAFSFNESSVYSIELTIDNIIRSIPATAKEITLGSPPVRWKELLGSCNGLVIAKDVNWDMFLMNPTTHDLWKLPVNPFADDTDKYFASYGFGYHSSTDDYKVVFICNSVSMYSLCNNFWRELPNTPHHVDHAGSCALVNGKCHWLTKNPLSIIAFSFVDEVFSEIKPPDSILNNNFWYSMMIEIGGRLGVYLCLKSFDSELWVMQEYGDAKSWTRVFSHGEYMRPLCSLQGSDRDIVSKYKDGVGLLNIDEGRRRNLRIFTGLNDLNFMGGAFIESIESRKRISTKVMDN